MNINLKSLGYRTDLIFNEYDGKIIDRGDYLVALTERNPHFFWGNFILIKDFAASHELDVWKDIFRKEVSHPSTYHMAFGWDSKDGSTEHLDQFIRAGFTFSQSIVLTATSINPPKHINTSIEVRPIHSDADFERVIEIQMLTENSDMPTADLETFYQTQMTRYRSMIADGRGLWFGAYIGNTMVASLGLFTSESLGRYQVVTTHPDHQRQGICGTLVHKTAQYAFETLKLKTLVMVADENYHAAKIYESVGFKGTEKMIGVSWYDKTKRVK